MINRFVQTVRVTGMVGIAVAGIPALAQNCQWDLSQSNPGMGGTVNNLFIFNGDLYATGGNFTTAGGATANRFARWTGSGWVEAGGGLANAANDYAIGDIGTGHSVFGVGPFTTAGGVAGTNRVARFDGTSFHQMADGLGSTPSSVGIVNNELYVGGSFTATGGGSPLLRLARWNGTNWEQVGPGIGDGSVTGITEFQGQLHIIGTFTRTGEATGWQTLGRGLARWDGTAFHDIGSGGLQPAPGESAGPATSGCMVWDGIGGESLYVWGGFGMAGGVLVKGLARWDGTQWHGVGGGAQQSNGTTTAWIRMVTVFNDGTGDALWIGSSALSSSGFHFVGDGAVPAQGIARFDGTSWSSPNITVNNNVFALQQFNDPTDEPVLWAGGQYTQIGGQTANRIARFVCDVPPPPPTCYANCDGSTTPPILNVDDFTCFINEFAAAQSLPHEQQVAHYANCDESLIAPVLNVDDFTCFINAFAQGCR